MSENYDAIRYVGPPAITPAGREVLEFHLHRFVAPWLNAHEVETVWLAVGFERTQAESAIFCVSKDGAVSQEPAWGFDDVVQTWRQGDGRLRVSDSESPGALLRVVPLLDHKYGVRDHQVLLGFALVPDGSATDVELEDLQQHGAEGIRAARRNAVRLHFDESAHDEVKSVLYGMLDHLPEWTGCDGSAAIVLSNSLDALTLDASGSADFHVMAERLYHGDGKLDRLVGMWLSADETSFLGAAVRTQRRTGRRAVQQFERADGDIWTVGDERYGAFHVAERDEHMVLMVPLLLEDEIDSELLGFLTLAYREPQVVSSATINTLMVLSHRLASYLRHSPLYTLSARKMWISEQVRQVCEEAVGAKGPIEIRRTQMIEAVIALVERHTGVPSFSVGHVGVRDGARWLEYESSFGWTDFDAIDLKLDVEPAARADSGVSALAVRLDRTLVLAGRRPGEDKHAFKNYLFVNEDTTQGHLVDARSPGGARVLAKGGDWVRLSDYYKPARSDAYACLAVPISFAGEVLGVVAVEVDRDTHWYWWSGYGGQLLWKLIAKDVAFALWVLR